MARFNAYAVLGLHPSAGPHAIHQAYMRLIRECHPDVAENPDPELAARVNAAYAILGNEQRRRGFDSNIANILDGWVGSTWGYRVKWCMHCARELHPSGAFVDGRYVPPERWGPVRSDARYCSNACRQAAYRARKAATRRLGPGS